MKIRLVSYASSQFMRSEKRKVLGALMPSESCHNEFEVSIFIIPMTWFIHSLWLFVLPRSFSLVFEKEKTTRLVCHNILRGKVAYATP